MQCLLFTAHIALEFRGCCRLWLENSCTAQRGERRERGPVWPDSIKLVQIRWSPTLCWLDSAPSLTPAVCATSWDSFFYMKDHLPFFIHSHSSGFLRIPAVPDSNVQVVNWTESFSVSCPSCFIACLLVCWTTVPSTVSSGGWFKRSHSCCCRPTGVFYSFFKRFSYGEQAAPSAAAASSSVWFCRSESWFPRVRYENTTAERISRRDLGDEMSQQPILLL